MAAKSGIEAQQLELFPERQHAQEPERADGRHGDDIAFQHGGRLTEQESVQAGLAGGGLALNEGQHDQPGSEEDAEHQRHGGVGLDARGANDTHDGHGRQPAGQGRADHQDQRGTAAGDQKGQRHAGQGRMRHRVAQQGLPPEHREGSESAADDSKRGRAERHGSKRVVQE